MSSRAVLPRDLVHDLAAVGRVPVDRRDALLRGLCADAWDGRYGDPGRAVLARLLSGRGVLGTRARAVREAPREEVLEALVSGEARASLDALVTASLSRRHLGSGRQVSVRFSWGRR